MSNDSFKLPLIIKFSDEIIAEIKANRQNQIEKYGYYLIAKKGDLIKVFEDGREEFYGKCVDHRKGANQ